MKPTQLNTLLGGLLMSLLLLSCNGKKEKSEPISGDILIKNVTYWSPDKIAITEYAYILISGDTILGISGDSAAFTAPIIIDGTDKFLIPGLAEMHAHVPTEEQTGAKLVEETLFLYLAGGVTTIRGMLGDPFHLELREKLANGDVLGPRLITSGPSFRGNTAPTPEEAEQKVRAQKEAGYDFMKLHPGLSKETFDKIVAVGEEVGLGYSGHVSFDVGIRHALRNGYGTIDHLDGYVEGLVAEETATTGVGGFFGFNFTDSADVSKIDELVDLTVETNTWVVPTQCLLDRWLGPEDPLELAKQPEMKYMNPATLERWVKTKQDVQASEGYTAERAQKYVDIRRQLLLAMHEKGVGILLGSDAPQVFNVPGFSIHREMQSMKDSGIPERAILVSGTSSPAEFFGLDEVFGSIETGKSADLVLLEANPLEDIANALEISGVMVRGKWLPAEEIEKRLSQIENSYK